MSEDEVRIRIEDEQVSVALSPDEFDIRLAQHVPEGTHVLDDVDRLVYWRGGLPQSPLRREQLLWLGGVVIAVLACYGLFALIRDVIASKGG
jgi:hypothetical protein